MNKNLKKKIEDMAERDQFVRKRAIKFPQKKSFVTAVVNQDAKSRIFVRSTIKKYGWPTYAIVGRRASHKFWLLVQHSDEDVSLQKEALVLLKNALDIGQASEKDFAYLTDRILVHENKKQVYGTQFFIKNKELFVCPVVNKKYLNQRRQKIGLEPLDNTIKKLKKNYKNLLK